jgi:hypothetical protein
MANVPDRPTKIKKPFLNERLRLSLERAGSAGRTTLELAIELYGDRDARGRVLLQVGTLRRKGIRIFLIRRPGDQSARYVLAEFAIPAEPPGEKFTGSNGGDRHG